MHYIQFTRFFVIIVIITSIKEEKVFYTHLLLLIQA